MGRKCICQASFLSAVSSWHSLFFFYSVVVVALPELICQSESKFVFNFLILITFASYYLCMPTLNVGFPCCWLSHSSGGYTGIMWTTCEQQQSLNVCCLWWWLFFNEWIAKQHLVNKVGHNAYPPKMMMLLPLLCYSDFELNFIVVTYAKVVNICDLMFI